MNLFRGFTFSKTMVEDPFGQVHDVGAVGQGVGDVEVADVVEPDPVFCAGPFLCTAPAALYCRQSFSVVVADPGAGRVIFPVVFVAHPEPAHEGLIWISASAHRNRRARTRRSSSRSPRPDAP